MNYYFTTIFLYTNILKYNFHVKSSNNQMVVINIFASLVSWCHHTTRTSTVVKISPLVQGQVREVVGSLPGPMRRPEPTSSRTRPNKLIIYLCVYVVNVGDISRASSWAAIQNINKLRNNTCHPFDIIGLATAQFRNCMSLK